jgi:hypothetical protein
MLLNRLIDRQQLFTGATDHAQTLLFQLVSERVISRPVLPDTLKQRFHLL